MNTVSSPRDTAITTTTADTGEGDFSASNKTLRDLIRDGEEFRHAEPQWKAREVNECINRVYGNGTGRLADNDGHLLKMLPFLPSPLRQRILEDAVSLGAFSVESVLVTQDLLTAHERQFVIEGIIPRANVRNQLAICAELKNASVYFTTEQVNSLLGGLLSFIHDPDHRFWGPNLHGVLPLLDDTQREVLFDAAISNENEVSRCNVLCALARGVRHLNQEQYERMLDSFIGMANDRRGAGLYTLARHSNQLNEEQRGQIFLAVNQIQNPLERDFALANLRSGLSVFSAEHRIQVFDAALRSGATWMLKDLCGVPGLMDEERRTRLYDALVAAPRTDIFWRDAVAKLAGQIAHLSPAQVDTVVDMATGTKNGLAELVRGRSTATGEQRKCIDGRDIVSSALRVADEDRKSTAINVLSPVIELLSEEELHSFTAAALNLADEDVKTVAFAAAGRVLNRLPEELSEQVIQTVERMAGGKNKVEAVIGLSRGMAHLGREQCERLLEVARRASPKGRFDEHNISALQALVSAKWP
ncbi:MAG TPA: hypothetical protein VFP68_01745 [Burkholderiaceae bacterium]|nr:hypothetical protein [Burkholderiaceae bacterium]